MKLISHDGILMEKTSSIALAVNMYIDSKSNLRHILEDHKRGTRKTFSRHFYDSHLEVAENARLYWRNNITFQY
jgi:hypothetical protein